MQLASINTAGVFEFEFSGKTVQTGLYKMPQLDRVKIERAGVVGDFIADRTVHGGVDQAVYLYSLEDYDWWSRQLGRALPPGSFGENLTVSGFTTSSLLIGDRIRINDVLLELTAPRTPCFKLAHRMNDPNFMKAFIRAARPGAYARVIEEGEVQVGDEMKLIAGAADHAGIDDVFVEWHRKERSVSLLKKALLSPIAAVHKRKIQQWYDQALADGVS